MINKLIVLILVLVEDGLGVAQTTALKCVKKVS